MEDTLTVDEFTFEFDDDAEYKNAHFVSIKKTWEWEGQPKYQTFTVKKKHWIQVREWLGRCLEASEEEEGGGKGKDTPF